MFTININKQKSFQSKINTTILQSAIENNVFLDHSCLTGRCKSCMVKVLSGTTNISKQSENALTEDEIADGFVLSCISEASSDLEIQGFVHSGQKLYQKGIFPAKILELIKINDNVIKLELKLPPNRQFKFHPGQYVNIIKGEIKRSYSIANAIRSNNTLSFFIKDYKGVMSKYWFLEARINDLLRIEGPLGMFFLRESNKENIIFLATGTGIAPIKSILLDLNRKPVLEGKKIWLFHGYRCDKDQLWSPMKLDNLANLNYIPVQSKSNEQWQGETGYIQDVVLNMKIPLDNSTVYACGSIEMISSAKNLFLQNKLDSAEFISDAFVESNQK